MFYVWLFALCMTTVPITSAPLEETDTWGTTEGHTFEEAVPEKSPVPILHDDEADPLVVASQLPISPLNVTDNAKQCPACGKGPQLACPKSGKCGDDALECCFDSCRKRQVCRPKAELSGSTNQTSNDTGHVEKREAQDGGDAVTEIILTESRNDAVVPEEISPYPNDYYDSYYYDDYYNEKPHLDDRDTVIYTSPQDPSEYNEGTGYFKYPSKSLNEI